MKSLDNLIRLHRWQLDERRRELVQLQELVASLESQAVQLERDLEKEQEAAKESPEGRFSYPGFARSVIERRRKIAESVAKLEREIIGADDRMRQAFQELKKYELMEANRLREIQANRDRVEQATLDELGVDIFRRRSSP